MIARLIDPIRPYLTGVALLALAGLLAWGLRVDHLRAVHLRDLADVRREYASFQTAIIDRTAEALRLDRARNARVTAQAAAITQETSNAYLKDRDTELARLRDRLRTAATADPGGSGDARSSALPVLSDGPVRPGEAAIVDVADAETCTINTLRLEGVIDAWRGIAAIDPNAKEDDTQ